MKNLIKIFLSIFLLSFASQNANAAAVKPFILQENVSDTLDLEDKTLTTKEKIETARMLSKYSLVFIIASIIIFFAGFYIKFGAFTFLFIKWYFFPFFAYLIASTMGGIFSYLLLKENKKYKDKIVQKFSLAAFILWATFQATIIIVGLLR